MYVYIDIVLFLFFGIFGYDVCMEPGYSSTCSHDYIIHVSYCVCRGKFVFDSSISISDLSSLLTDLAEKKSTTLENTFSCWESDEKTDAILMSVR